MILIIVGIALVALITALSTYMIVKMVRNKGKCNRVIHNINDCDTNNRLSVAASSAEKILGTPYSQLAMQFNDLCYQTNHACPVC